MSGYLFGDRAAQRIKVTVLKTERPEFPNGQNFGQPVRWQPGTLDAIVTTAITRATNSTYGVGAAQIVIPTQSGNSYTASNDASFNGPVTVINWSQGSGSNNANTVNTGTHIGVYWRNGFFELAWNDC